MMKYFKCTMMKGLVDPSLFAYACPAWGGNKYSLFIVKG